MVSGCSQGQGTKRTDGRGGEGNSRRSGVYVHIELIHFVVQQKLTQHCKANYTPIKKKKHTFKSEKKKEEEEEEGKA